MYSFNHHYIFNGPYRVWFQPDYNKVNDGTTNSNHNLS